LHPASVACKKKAESITFPLKNLIGEPPKPTKFFHEQNFLNQNQQTDELTDFVESISHRNPEGINHKA
jgi:hypothetical protein